MKYRWDKKYLYWGVTIFLVILASLASIGVIFQFQSLMGTIGWALSILKPVMYGLVIAFLVNPILKALEKLFCLVFRKKIQASQKPRKWKSACRATCTTLSILIVLAALAGLLSLVIPQLITSITGIVDNFGTYYANLQNWMGDILSNHPDVSGTIEDVIQELFKSLQEWAKTLPSQTGNILSSVADGVMGTIGVFTNFIIGFIIAIYFLFNKEKFIAQLKKVVYAMFKKERANSIIELGQQTNQMFGGFITGQILDSLIVGVICFIGTSILGTPYSLLISVIVTVTNVIPFFGPFIGAIPSGFLILMVDPLQCLYFVIWIVILQQIDGNIISPRIQGNITGLSGFWVIFAITIFGGLFGIVGIFIAVPAFAVLYIWIKRWIDRGLKKRKMSLSTETYMQTGCIYQSDETEPLVDPDLPEPKEIDPEVRRAAEAEAASRRRSKTKMSGWMRKLRNKKKQGGSKGSSDSGDSGDKP